MTTLRWHAPAESTIIHSVRREQTWASLRLICQHASSGRSPVRDLLRRPPSTELKGSRASVRPSSIRERAESERCAGTLSDAQSMADHPDRASFRVREVDVIRPARRQRVLPDAPGRRATRLRVTGTTSGRDRREEARQILRARQSQFRATPLASPPETVRIIPERYGGHMPPLWCPAARRTP